MIELIETYCRRNKFKLAKQSRDALPAAVIKDTFNQIRGHWQQIKPLSDIDLEIQTLIYDGFPIENTLFEDGETAVLFQNKTEITKINFTYKKHLQNILHQFMQFETEEHQTFREAVENFVLQLPSLLVNVDIFLQIIGNERKATEFPQLTAFKDLKNNPAFIQQRSLLVDICKEALNPQISMSGIRYFIIEHIFLEPLYAHFFNDIFKKNYLNKILKNVVQPFQFNPIFLELTKEVWNNYEVFYAKAQKCANSNEKMDLLEVMLLNTPFAFSKTTGKAKFQELDKFIFQSTDALLQKHFAAQLADKNINCLFLGALHCLENFIHYLPKKALTYKLQNECFCSLQDISLHYQTQVHLSTHIESITEKNTNIENLILVDFLQLPTKDEGKQVSLFGFTSENSEKIHHFQEKKINVIIGDLSNLADFRKSHPLDQRVRNTYLKNSPKIRITDEVVRYFRWATDKLEQGLMVWILNPTFVKTPLFDLIKSTWEEEMKLVYILDLEEYVLVYLLK